MIQKKIYISLILIICLIDQTNGIIKYDSGSFSGFSECVDGYSETFPINFNGVFANVPQVILGLEYILLYEGEIIGYKHKIFRQQVLYFYFQGFELFITCVTSAPFKSATYKWYAIDDQRIQVINNFNMLNPTDKIFTHENANANFGIVTLTSMGVYQDVNFKIFISSITTTQVSVSLTNNLAWIVNLKQIGYQIILGIQEALTDVEVLYHTSAYDSGTLTQYSNKWLFLTYNGFIQLLILDQRLCANQKHYHLLWIQVSVAIILDYGTFLKNHHLKGWLTQQYTTIFKAFEFLTLRISQSYDLEISTKPDIFLEINEITQSFSASTNIIIDKTLNIVNMKIYTKCIKTKIVSQFLKCQDCSNNKYYQFSHYCHGTINEISYFPRFKLTLSAYKEININILLNRITITEVLYNQIKSIQTLVDIQIQNS